jgi:O-antigen/teichoic acid export membrane protein
VTRAEERVVGRNFLALGGGDALARVIAFGATAYLTRVLGADGYGVIAVASAVTLYLAQLASFGIDTLGIREVAEDRKKIDDLVPSILTLRIAYTTLLAVLAAAISMLAVPPPDGPVIAAFALTLIPQAAATKWVLLGLESAAPVAVSRIAGEALTVLLILGLVRGAADLWAVPAASVAGEFAAAIMLLIVLRRRGHRMPVDWDLEKARPIFARAWPIVGHSLLGLLIYNSDLIFLRLLRTSREVGLYAAAYTLISFLINLGVAYGTSLLPTLTRLGRGSAEEQALYQSAHAQVFAASLPISLGGALLAAPLMSQVFGADYHASGLPLSILIWSVPFSLFRNVAIAGLVARERQDQMLKTTVWSTALNVLLNLLLIPRWGMAGAAFATLATEVLRTALALLYARQESLHFASLARHLRACAAGAAMVGVLYLLRPYGLWEGLLTWSAIAIGGAVYVVAMIAAGGIRFSGGRPRLQV